MASTFQSVNVTGARPAVIANGAETVTVRGEYEITAALVINDLVELVNLPADHVVTDCIIYADDLDTNGTPLITLGAGKTGGTGVELIAANTLAQAGGMARLDTAGGLQIAPATSEVAYGVKVVAAPATGATTGTIGMQLSYKAARYAGA